MITKAIDHAPGLEHSLFTKVREDSYLVEQIEGEIPSYIRGTYYLNGPARFERGGLIYQNWLDGDGMVCSLRFDYAGVRFISRFVRGHKFTEEEELGAPIYATFGTRFEGDRMRRGIVTESPYNVSVYRYHDQLLAFGEQSIPVALDPGTLETRGVFDFDRQLNSVTPFSAHPKIDCTSGELLNYGISFSEHEPCLNFFRFDTAGVLACRRRIPIDYPCSIHDFAISSRHAVFYLSPYILNVSRLMSGGISTMDALDWQPELGSRLLVLDRETGNEHARVHIDGRYCLHTINCFERGGQLFFDVIEFERPLYDQYQVLPDLFSTVSAGCPVRYRLDLATGKLIAREEIAYRAAPDFPSIDPRCMSHEYDDCWMLGIRSAGQPGRKFFNQLAHVQWSSDNISCYQADDGWFLAGEPVFVADPQRPQVGSVICQLLCPQQHRFEFAIFDAYDVVAGPVARLPLQEPSRLGFHASFDPLSARD